MSTPMKKRELEMEGSSGDESETYSSENEEGEEYTGGEEIQIEFEGRNPCDSDYHGIKQLLKQLFLKAHINLSELTDLIIGQNFVGSVIKQSDAGEAGDDGNEDDEDDDVNDVYGITTVVNLTDKQSLECVAQLRTLLSDLVNEHGTDQVRTQIRSMLDDPSKPLGLIINERFINIPAQISVPLFESLCKEIKKACGKGMAFDFSYYIFICKLYKTEGNPTTKMSKKRRNRKMKDAVDEDILWGNPEEEVLDQAADLKFEFSVKDETDTALAGNWLDGDVPMTPYRRVLILSKDKLEPLVQRIQGFVAR